MAEKEKKDQFIIAYLADTRQPEAVLSYAVYMSQKLGKGLVLLHICDPKYSTLTTAEACISLALPATATMYRTTCLRFW